MEIPFIVTALVGVERCKKSPTPNCPNLTARLCALMFEWMNVCMYVCRCACVYVCVYVCICKRLKSASAVRSEMLITITGCPPKSISARCQMRQRWRKNRTKLGEFSSHTELWLALGKTSSFHAPDRAVHSH
jgi:hypothetical protein